MVNPSVYYDHRKNREVLTRLVETFAVMGQSMSDDAVRLILDDLSAFSPTDILQSLAICRRTCRKVYLVDICQNIPGAHRPTKVVL
jgi:hypothetical protein